MDEQVKKSKKRQNPREHANLFTVLTFLYTLPLFLLGNTRDINESDLYETFTGHKASILGKKSQILWQEELDNAIAQKRKPSLLKVLVKILGWDFLLIGIAVGCENFVAQPCKALFLGGLIGHYAKKDSSGFPSYLYSLGIIVSTLFCCLIVQPYLMASYHMGLKMRVVCSSLIYNKILKLSPSSIRKSTPGYIINLLSGDINAFERVGGLLHMLWIGPLQAILFLYLAWTKIGVSSTFGIGFMVMFIPVYVLLGSILKRYRLKVSTRRDERIRLTNELIQGINVIKMYAWEKPFAEIISTFRKLEVDSMMKSTYLKGLFTFNEILIATSIFITIISSVLLNDAFEATAVFITMNLFFSLGLTVTTFFPLSIAVLAEFRVSLKRISAFLQSQEIDFHTKSEDSESAVAITSGFAKWDENGNRNTLTDINIHIKKNSLTALIGAVGCGKSSLFQVIQGELPLSIGLLCVNGSLSCAPQEAWIFSASIRQNILFGSEMDEERYMKVIDCCALETDLKLFPHGDQTIVGERGTSLSGGQKARINLARCVYRKAGIYLLDDPLSAVDSRVGKHIFENCIRAFLNEKTVLLATHQLQYLAYVDYVIALDEGAVQMQSSEKELEASKFDLSRYISQNHSASRADSDSMLNPSNVKDPAQVQEARKSGFISIGTYKRYLFASNNLLFVICTVLLFIFAELSISGSIYFIGHWINVEQHQHVEDRGIYMQVYCGIAVAAVCFAILRLITFVTLTMASSRSLHDTMFTRLLHSSMKFFNSNTSGRILNRFSKDLLSMDEVLPNMAVIAILIILNVSGLLIVICVVNPWFIIPTVLVLGLLFFIRRFYLSTNLGILRVESVVRSPLYGHVQATLQGLPTIRTFGVQETLTNEFNNYLDTHSTALHMSYSVSRAFGYWIDLLSFIFVSITVIFYMLKEEAYSGNVGLVITQSLRLIGQLPWGMRHLTDVENCMVSVERVLEYTTIEGERALKSAPNLKPSVAWPSLGGIKFKNVSLRYSPDEPFVLKGLNFVVEPLQKIGIVGRTGAGKSSIIAALFQLAETKGSIIIDGVDITIIGLHDLRKKMSIIPQDPVIFSGTIRNNLDPFKEFPDDILWSALEDVKLKEIVNQLPSGLSFSVSHDGSNLSVGQRQLLCLARAIIRRNRILILDEATANVDLETDAIIQDTIRTKFAKCTVLTVAHRINTIIDCDKILVMSAGELVEFDHPHTLLQKEDGVFCGMVRQMDVSMVETLRNTARKTYRREKSSVTHM
ncbi:probable multidrug resistance-associated protein lethal(2)03659 isoform X2 [Photinus pyralis]|uniref:probable multidrug resistance-associated protein lethal(2)03659 isoform X2 n=1 Tax=Photinus pyralis TaxID=7054 RepID=UPI001266F1A3|nr:probable multidrug resistance-associated protein lethal(2)03659 isoform X2 [Photinus pyralis]